MTHAARGTSVIRSIARPMAANSRTDQSDALTIAPRSLIEV
jgi:hypothetical protein